MTDYPIVIEPQYLDRHTLATPPPAPGYVQHGWYCTYHPSPFCHNPLDCDFVPIWRPAGKALREIRDTAEPTRVTLADLARKATAERKADERAVRLAEARSLVAAEEATGR